MKHQSRLAQSTGAQCTELYGIYVQESRGCYCCGRNIYILAVSERSASESSMISRLIDRMSPSRHRSNTEGGLTEEQEDELGHIFKVRVVFGATRPLHTANITPNGILVCSHWSLVTGHRSQVTETSDHQCSGISCSNLIFFKGCPRNIIRVLF